MGGQNPNSAVAGRQNSTSFITGDETNRNFSMLVPIEFEFS